MLYVRRAAAPEYYLTPDTPTVDGELEARWGGKGSRLLGLEEFGELSFLRLAKGLNPETGSKLTARLKANRKDADDLTVTVPKSVSIAIEVLQDERVKAALWEANEYVMGKFEKKAKVRERRGGVYKDRTTGNITYASFYHGTTRPIEEQTGKAKVDGLDMLLVAGNDNPKPDPHAHIHNYVVNVSWDKHERQWKAMKRHHFDLPDLQKQFHKRLAKNLRKAGYKLEKTKDAFEIKGITPEVRDAFSRRQGNVKEAELERPYLNEPGNATHQKAMGAAKAKLSQSTRQKKPEKPLTRVELHRFWVSRLSGEQFATVAGVAHKARHAVNRDRVRAVLRNRMDKLRQFVRQETSRELGRGR